MVIHTMTDMLQPDIALSLTRLLKISSLIYTFKNYVMTHIKIWSAVLVLLIPLGPESRKVSSLKSEISVSAEISFVNLNLSRISAETKISDLSKISEEIWLRLETFRETGPRNLCLVLNELILCFKNKSFIEIIFISFQHLFHRNNLKQSSLQLT